MLEVEVDEVASKVDVEGLDLDPLQLPLLRLFLGPRRLVEEAQREAEQEVLPVDLNRTDRAAPHRIPTLELLRQALARLRLGSRLRVRAM
jgi:flagellar motor switch protein FliM